MGPDTFGREPIRARSAWRRGERADARARLEEGPKLLVRQSRIADDARHGDGVDRIVAGNGQDAMTVTHHDVPSLAHDRKPCLL